MDTLNTVATSLETSLRRLLTPLGLWDQYGQDFLDYVRTGRISPKLSDGLQDNQHCRKAMDVVVTAKVSVLYEMARPIRKATMDSLDTPQQAEGAIRDAVMHCTRSKKNVPAGTDLDLITWQSLPVDFFGSPKHAMVLLDAAALRARQSGQGFLNYHLGLMVRR